jgi:DNA-directed RNA polymerase subunit RPC12/RpoP
MRTLHHIEVHMKTYKCEHCGWYGTDPHIHYIDDDFKMAQYSCPYCLLYVSEPCRAPKKAVPVKHNREPVERITVNGREKCQEG